VAVVEALLVKIVLENRELVTALIEKSIRSETMSHEQTKTDSWTLMSRQQVFAHDWRRNREDLAPQTSLPAGPFCGGLAVDPLLLSNLSSATDMLLSLFTDRRLQSSGRGGEDWKLVAGLAKICCGVLGGCGLWRSLGGKGGVEAGSESIPLSESFVLRLLSDRLRENPGESE